MNTFFYGRRLLELTALGVECVEHGTFTSFPIIRETYLFVSYLREKTVDSPKKLMTEEVLSGRGSYIQTCFRNSHIVFSKSTFLRYLHPATRARTLRHVRFAPAS